MRVHPVHLMNVEWRQAAADPQTKPDDLGHQPTYRMPESTPTEVSCIKKPKPHIWKTFRMQTELNHGPYRMRTEPEPKLLNSFPSLPATHRHHRHSSTEAQGWRSYVIVRSVIHSVCLSFMLSVSRITLRRGKGRRPNMVDTGNG